MHVLIPEEGEGRSSVEAPPHCECPRRHLVHGRTYLYCTCGRSKNQVRAVDAWWSPSPPFPTHLSPSLQPLCDGIGCLDTAFKPLEFTVEKKQTYYLLCAW
jgi:hypothetical protein